MMQRRWRHGSSGELDVFGATSYFAAGLLDCPISDPADRLIQESKVSHITSMDQDDEQLGLHGHDERHTQPGLGVVGNKPSGNKSKLAALLSFVLSPSPRASFRKESLPLPPASKTMLAAGDEPAKASSSSFSSRESSVHELDLGVATGDRRLQGVRIVRGSGGGEERWVVRCSAWEEEEDEHHERMMLDAAESKSSDGNKDEVEEGDDGNDPAGGWESDCSSDLFDLDI
ncbi:unnamed protein product [Urochloa decumbens]|uniref:Uncharacterized protein n=1 Tax=Urochloa decumbens TaxID=240449 RepID=A0ABC8XVS0_9POAL